MKTRASLMLLAGLVAFGCGKGSSDTAPEAGIDAGSQPCPWDEDDDPAAAGQLSLGASAEGYICPLGDQDWYAFEIPTGSDLLTVGLAIDAPLSPLDLAYAVWDVDADEVVATPEASEAASSGVFLDITHGLASGAYRIVVRDRGDDDEDVRHAYRLTLAGGTDNDANERNDTAEQATAWGGDPAQGYISYRGDEDWFSVEIQERELLSLTLTMPAGGIQPACRVTDGDGQVLDTQTNPSGAVEDTELTWVQSFEAAGTYYVVISDDDGLDVDFDTPYTLNLTLQPDPDENEPNDHPNSATILGDRYCGGLWSDWSSGTGYLSYSGDVDWFGVDLEGCHRGLIEAEVEFDGAGQLPEGLQAVARLVRRTTVPCDIDQDCQDLSLACDNDLDCSWKGNTCLASGLCAGASVCLADGGCGADIITESAPETVPDPESPQQQIINPDRGRVGLSAPIRSYGNYRFYVVVSDYHSDAFTTNQSYTVRVRTRKDPDLNEPSELYTGGPASVDDGAAGHATKALEVPVHDCTPDADGGPDCCDGDSWVEGYVSYSYDQDWFKYAHPCPGEDCMVRVVYEAGAGPVDFYMQIYQDTTPWFDNLLDIVDLESQPELAGQFGGLAPTDYCFYAFSGHEGDPFWYYLPVRDTVYVGEGQEEAGSWDRSADQPYRFCVEKIADGCFEPCVLYEDGCGTPTN